MARIEEIRCHRTRFTPLFVGKGIEPMKWTKTAMAWSLAALLFATATGSLLWAQQPGAPDLPAAAPTPEVELGQTPTPAVGLGQPQIGAAGPSSTAAVPVAKPPSGVNLYPVQPSSAYSPANMSPFGAAEADDPETAELRQADGALARKSEQLVAQHAATEDDEQRGGVKTLLAEVLVQQFSVQQQLRDRELARVEARVKKLRELTQKRREAQRTIIEQRLDQLLREADGLGWTSPGAPGTNFPYSQQPVFHQFFNKTQPAVQQNRTPTAAPAITIGAPARQ
jgi:hypothetical protein